jgi:hypothetical protein
MLHDLIPGLIIVGVLVILIVFALGYQVGYRAAELAASEPSIEPREAMVARIANLAGVDAEGGILPPDATFEIDRSPLPWWKS